MSFRLALGIVALAATAGCGSSYSGGAPTSPSPTGGGSAVSIVAGASSMTTTAYAPNPIVVSAGGTVTWTNNDTTAHTATADDGAWTSGTIAAGGKYSRTFPSAGTFAYHCTFHRGMIGTVTVQ